MDPMQFLQYPFLLGCALPPLAVLVTIRRHIENKGLIDSNNRFRIPKELQSFDIFAAAVIWLSLYTLIIAASYGLIFGQKPQAVAVALFLVIPIFTTTLSVNFLKQIIPEKRLSTIFNYSLAFGGILFAWIGGSLAAGYVSEKADLASSELPYAVIGLTILYTILLWNMVAAAGFFLLYVFTAYAIAKIDKQERESKVQPSLVAWKGKTVRYALFIGLAFSATGCLNIINFPIVFNYLKYAERYILNNTGYPLEKHWCAPNSLKQDRFTILSDGNLALAHFVSESETKYLVIECKRTVTKWNAGLEQSAIAEEQK